MRLVATLLLTAATVLPLPATADGGSHALSLYGDVKYGPGFSHYDYVNPDAPVGGTFRAGTIGTYDTFNPYVIKGTPAAGLGLIYETLMEGSADEPMTTYGVLAESAETADDRSSVSFTLRAEARWHDGKPVTPEDVVFSFDILKAKGRPFFRYYYANVTRAEVTGERRVTFTFDDLENRELPIIIAGLPVLPKHYWEGREFDATTLEPPVGSGPYRIAEFDEGRAITYERVENYWGANVPAMRGRWNWQRMRYDYYRDLEVMHEAFKSGAFDFKLENSAKRWATGYDFPAVKDGTVIVEEVPDNTPQGMQGFVFNQRRAKFQDRRVRQALNLTFDFEALNRTLFYSQYSRTDSYFDASELAAEGLPEGRELEILETVRDSVPPEVFTTPYQPMKTDGSGNIRRQLRQARTLLEEAGWTIRDGALTHAQSGELMEIEFLYRQDGMEKVLLPMAANWKRLGIRHRLRRVDSSQYVNRVRAFDYDMIVGQWGAPISPGNEQRNYWGSASADQPGSSNYAGIKDPAVDALVDAVIAADSREDLVAATRALDRVLLWGHHVIPHYHTPVYRLAYRDRFGKPAVKPKYGIGLSDTWWVDPEKDAALKRGGGN